MCTRIEDDLPNPKNLHIKAIEENEARKANIRQDITPNAMAIHDGLLETKRKRATDIRKIGNKVSDYN